MWQWNTMGFLEFVLCYSVLIKVVSWKSRNLFRFRSAVACGDCWRGDGALMLLGFF